MTSMTAAATAAENINLTDKITNVCNGYCFSKVPTAKSVTRSAAVRAKA